jgi:hypothetical protein
LWIRVGKIPAEINSNPECRQSLAKNLPDRSGIPLAAHMGSRRAIADVLILIKQGIKDFN